MSLILNFRKLSLPQFWTILHTFLSMRLVQYSFENSHPACFSQGLNFEYYFYSQRSYNLKYWFRFESAFNFALIHMYSSWSRLVSFFAWARIRKIIWFDFSALANSALVVLKVLRLLKRIKSIQSTTSSCLFFSFNNKCNK